MIPRTLYSEEHAMLRDSVRRFCEEEIAPHHAQWEKDGQISREAWLEAGKRGFLGCSIPEEYGGVGGDFLMSAVITEELARVGATGPGFQLHSEIVAPYILNYGTEEQKRRWLPRMVSGEAIGAIAMTEPGAGSDLQGIRTSAVRDGNEFVLNGQKVFISNGQMADVTIVVAKTDKDKGAKGISLFLVERDREGFRRGRNLEKVGWKAQDTSELFFEDVRLPPENMLGEENKGFFYLIDQLPQERLQIAIRSAQVIETALEQTIAYVAERKAFGKPISAFQNTRFKLAEMKAKAEMMRIYVDRLTELHLDGGLNATDAAMAKLSSTDLMMEVLDECMQLHGGYGYMWEYPVARAWADNRMSRIAGGTAEIMKEIIGRSLFDA
ncbi:acyl-CoA dehydrogenase family protein [Mameliella sediminis]|uniref:acyl-CoA dehydrogenase family protein n=1 Tax=Mameliella sediminis TaxID=2836866 RepID=UPI001C439343|nr:acyl-CoA dehydrogenase family protein [Mameliella sediminis]MBY6116040.1 acyl-CoA dehydrogenase family protein [Antarctobacter heliothermus]MBY6145182.1 acyl-CoA dehydrogenase family protein [Mameliella alba]MBV7394079.1 acyl-CoA dehydrogenase family protein [Mameliella sediminis]MBY6162007.1 acyl-CoA dehydrogenase family protein [Mameliella alba]MBY6170477.1 acyl-CoA dehydrogenase family protein [Mameliella alba]